VFTTIPAVFHRFALAASLVCLPLVAQDPLTKQAISRIDEIAKKEATLAAGDTKTAEILINNLDQAAKRLAAVNDKTEATWKDAQKRCADLRQRIVDKSRAPAPAPAKGVDADKLAQLDKEVGAAASNFKMLSTKHLADPYRQQATKKELDGLAARIAQFPADDESVKPVAARIAELQKLFADAMAKLEKDVGEGASVASRLAALDAKYDAKNLPQTIEPPFTVPQVASWTIELLRWRDVELATDTAFLDEAAKNAAVDQQHVSRLRGWLDEGWRRRIAELGQTVRSRIEGDVADGKRFADFVLETDPKDKDQVANRILGKGRFDENIARLRAAERAVAIAAAFDRVTTGAEGEDRRAATAHVQKAAEHLRNLAVVCLDAVRMPPPASTNAELLAIAAEALKNPVYGAGAAERMVINADRTHHERRDGWIKSEAGATTVTIHTYVWDQFQVTTAERLGDDVWLFANTLKHFTSGDPTTAVGRWVLADRIQLTRILPENVGK